MTKEIIGKLFGDQSRIFPKIQRAIANALSAQVAGSDEDQHAHQSDWEVARLKLYSFIAQ